MGALCSDTDQAAERPLSSEDKKLVYIGTYTEKGYHYLGDELGKGVYTFKLNEDGSMTQQCDPAPGKNPAFVRTTPDGKFLYASNEVMNFEGGSTLFNKEKPLPNDGSITSYSVDRTTGKLTKINQVSSGGGAACHISVDKTGT